MVTRERWMDLGAGLGTFVTATALVVGVPGCTERNAAASDPAPPAPMSAPQPGASGRITPVVVELYTSEGCSSCPPADAVLAKIEAEQPLPGIEIVPLAFHVDYWDSLGWTDPFGLAANHGRQTRYAQAHGKNGVYTPEAVVDGENDVNGGDRGALLAMITEAATHPKPRVALRHDGDQLRVDVPASVPGGDVVVLWVQSRARINVLHGENGGRTLDHSAIVRRIVNAGRANGKDAQLATPWITKVDATSDVHPVVLVEDSNSGRVVATGSI